jgi:hypothetical protein
MGKHERRAYLDAIRGRYRKADRAGKTRILDEFCAVCGYHRKYAIRLLGRKRPEPTSRRVGRKPRYDHPRLLEALRRIWLASDQLCGKRLKVALPLWLPHYEAEHGVLPEAVRAGRVAHPKGLCGTKPGTLLKKRIPIRCEHWDVTQPGSIEADTVAHCGNSLAGDFAWSLTMTDILTGWTECRATWNKGAQGVIRQIQAIEAALPFPLRGFDCDNGSEFLNHHLVRYVSDHPDKPSFTRSRPYRKNDDAHVEQKNWSQVRHLFGYDRFDNPRLVDLMNDLYANEWSQLQNHFCPTLKLKEKSRQGSRYTRRHHPPETSYQRVVNSGSVAETIKRCLEDQHWCLNPFDLKRRIETKLTRIFSMASVSSNVRQRI